MPGMIVRPGRRRLVGFRPMMVRLGRPVPVVRMMVTTMRRRGLVTGRQAAEGSQQKSGQAYTQHSGQSVHYGLQNVVGWMPLGA